MFSSENSRNDWRQIPHGEAAGSVSVTTTMNSIVPAPSFEIQLDRADRSAQAPAPKLAFSKLHPEYSVEDPFAFRQDPTRN